MKKQLRRVLVLLLAFTMCFGSAVTLFAADAEVTCPGADKVHTKANCEYVAEEVVAPLCGKNGYTIYACTACHTHFVDDVTPALGGCSEFKVVAEVPATCEKAGVKAHKECVVCGAKYIGDTLYTDEQLAIKAGHTWGEWKETYVACGKATAKVRTCTVCGKEEEANGAKTEHKWVVTVTEEPNAETNKTGKATAECEYCHATRDIVVYPDNHVCKKLTKHAAVKATCAASGLKADYYECACGKKYADEKATKLITDEEFEKNYVEQQHPSTASRTIPATCESYGHEMTICKDCGETLEDKKIAPLGHDWLTYPYDIYYNYETRATSNTAEEGFTLIHKKGDVIEDYSGFKWNNGERTLYSDTICGRVIRYCLNATVDDNYSQLASGGLLSTWILDENGIDLRITVSISDESKFYGVVSEDIEEAKGHDYKKVTIPADCGHVSMTFYTCTNENCYDKLHTGGTGNFMLDKEGRLIFESTKYDATTQTNVHDYYYYREKAGKYGNYSEVRVADEDVTKYSRLLNGESVKMIVDADHPVTFGKDVDAKNHAIKVMDENKSKAATCTVNGYNVGTCYCGEEIQVEVPATGHKFYISRISKPTCTKEGTAYWSCANGCGETKTTTIPVIAASEKTEMTWDEFMTWKRLFSYEGRDYYGFERNDIHRNFVIEVVRKASCTQPDLVKYTCKDCGKVYTIDMENAKGHTDPGVYTKMSADGKLVEAAAEAEHYEYLADVKGADGKTIEHKKGDKVDDATAATLKGKTKDELKKLGFVLVPAKTAAYFCTECGEFVASKTAAHGGHTIDTTQKVNGTPATHLTDGLKDHYVCSVCGAKVLEDGTSAVIKAEGHKMTKVAGIKATCTEAGRKEYYVCTSEECEGKIFVIENKKYVETTEAALVIDATGHKEGTPVSSKRDCLTIGYDWYTCATCKADYIKNFKAAGHTTVDVAEKKPTCTADGYTKHKACKDCDYTEGKTIIPATGHKDKDGTFTDCNRKGRTCLNNCNLGKDKKPVAFTDNKHAPETKDVLATCTAAGYTMTVCTKCNEVLKVENPVAALGHDMQDKDTWTVVVAPTEVSAGKATSKCMNPNCDYEEEVVIPKLSDLKLNITADNAVVAGETIVESGKVKVTVSISSLDSDIWGTNFTVKYDAKMFSFDRAEVITENFLVNANALTKVVNKATVQTGDVKVLATAKNDEAGNPQNVKLAGTETLVELYFTVVGNAAEQQTFEIVEPSAGDLDGNKEIKASGVATVDVAQIADVDGIAGINVNDLSALLRLMRNEEYSAAADLDKDGEITALDFTLLVNYLSGFATMKDIRNATAE